jgi:hypothetical protein
MQVISMPQNIMLLLRALWKLVNALEAMKGLTREERSALDKFVAGYPKDLVEMLDKGGQDGQISRNGIRVPEDSNRRDRQGALK